MAKKPIKLGLKQASEESKPEAKPEQVTIVPVGVTNTKPVNILMGVANYPITFTITGLRFYTAKSGKVMASGHPARAIDGAGNKWNLINIQLCDDSGSTSIEASAMDWESMELDSE